MFLLGKVPTLSVHSVSDSKYQSQGNKCLEISYKCDKTEKSLYHWKGFLSSVKQYNCACVHSDCTRDFSQGFVFLVRAL